MNRKIYFDSNYILLTEDEYQPSENQTIIRVTENNWSQIKTELENFIQQKTNSPLILTSKNVNSLFEKLKKEFKHIEAAGGLIKKDDRYLFIFRLGKWDLPKGKLDKGETPSEAALRECEEECAINGLEIIKEIPDTYHIYFHKEKFVLKTTYWFLMKTSFTGKLIPQTEENIEKAEWLSENEIKKSVIQNTYPSILELVKSMNIIN